MDAKKVFQFEGGLGFKRIFRNKLFLFFAVFVLTFSVILFITFYSFSDAKTEDNEESPVITIDSLQIKLSQKDQELQKVSKKLIQIENEFTQFKNEVLNQKNLSMDINDPFSNLYDMNLYYYENPYFYHTEEDTKFIRYDNYDEHLRVSKHIISEKEILYHIKFGSFYLQAPHTLDEESHRHFCGENDKPPMAQGDCEKHEMSMTEPYYTTGNMTFVKDFSFDRIPECLETTRMTIITPAQSNYFQHWIDHGLCPIIQARPYIKDKGYTLLVLRPVDQIVYSFWDIVKKEFNVEIEYYQPGTKYDADEFLMACGATIWNPRLIYESKNFLVKSILETYSDLEIRNPNPEYIIYLPRINSRNGRNVLNSNEVEDYLKKRYGDKFKYFSHRDYSDLKKLVNFFNNAKAVIGAHGGSFYNIIFSLSHPKIIEFQTSAKLGSRPIFWWFSHSSGCEYWRVYANSKGSDMRIPLDKLEDVLNRALNENFHSKF
ncbi:hypothetical protein M0811_09996 [Anaeramoeba ignava]|uniref:Glycosyltransferase 61 catalytic domain-containing protein n=1 Tax=Anaeramoeba ignava TaxID=1746090 RepID=A0A9Q0LFN2_ANAIG|nr:hypothetical protein M0811_09996 [Anaeramoeba ignava]